MRTVKLSRKGGRWSVECYFGSNERPGSWYSCGVLADAFVFIESFFGVSEVEHVVEVEHARPIVRVTCAEGSLVCICGAAIWRPGQPTNAEGTVACPPCGRRWIHSASVTANGVTSWDWDLVTEGRA